LPASVLSIVQVIDSLGNIIQRVIDPATGLTKSQSVVGNYTNMTPLGGHQLLPDGSYIQSYTYNPFGTIVDVTFSAAGQVLHAVVKQPSA
jgi:hypothetical protein